MNKEHLSTVKTEIIEEIFGMKKLLMLILLLLIPMGGTLFADDPISAEMFTVNNTWMLVATFLVFIMHLGFATLEAGLTRPKNTVNILFKNTAIVAIGILTYALDGFNLMYPGEFFFGKVLGFAGFGLATDEAGIPEMCSILTLALSFPYHWLAAIVIALPTIPAITS